MPQAPIGIDGTRSADEVVDWGGVSGFPAT